MKVDLVMWAKNGESVLPFTLKRIDEVIPSENVHRKILIDDHSSDRTVEIAKKFGWEVHPNPKTGVESGTKEALRLVDCQFFVSIEQDVILAKNWWSKIPKYMDDPTVAVAQGIRISTEPVLRKIDKYASEREDDYWCDHALRRYSSIDNNFCRTDIIRRFGYYSENLIEPLNAVGLKWVVDRAIVSDHIRSSISEGILHDYKMTAMHPETLNILTLVRLFITSPIRAADIARKERSIKVLVTYPADRFAIMMAWIKNLLE